MFGSCVLESGLDSDSKIDYSGRLCNRCDKDGEIS